jgi:hypothetical protein
MRGTGRRKVVVRGLVKVNCECDEPSAQRESEHATEGAPPTPHGAIDLNRSSHAQRDILDVAREHSTTSVAEVISVTRFVAGVVPALGQWDGLCCSAVAFVDESDEHQALGVCFGCGELPLLGGVDGDALEVAAGARVV